MTTEREIQQIAERLRVLMGNDNDTSRLMREYLLCPEIKKLEDKIEELLDKLYEINKIFRDISFLLP